jgi:hypothetical protein
MLNLIKLASIFSKNLARAMSIIEDAQRYAGLKAKYTPGSLDERCGVHLGTWIERVEKYDKFAKRQVPYRFEGDLYEIRMPDGGFIYSSGNELENDINGKTLTPTQILGHHRKLASKHGKKLAGPALMTLRQNPSVWRSLLKLGAESEFSHWCINNHGPGFIEKYLNGIGSYILWVKILWELLDFKDATTLPVLITEAGNGQYHWACSKADMLFQYYCYSKIFGPRLKLILYYDADLAQRQGQLDQF